MKLRPRNGVTPRVGKRLAETYSPEMCSGSPVPVKLKSSLRVAPISVKDRLSRRQSRKFGYATELWLEFESVSEINVSRLALGYARGRSSTPLTTLKMAV